MEWMYILSGFVVGFIVGLSGVGGGSLMTPLLVLVFGVAPVTAVGTDLLYAAITKATGVWVHGRRGNVEWKVVGRLALGSIPAALLVLWGMSALGGTESEQFSHLITCALGFALILTAGALIFREQLQKAGKGISSALSHAGGRGLIYSTVVSGALLGALVTVSSVGAGALGVMVLFMLYPRLPTIKLIGSDIAHAVPLTALAGFGYLYLGAVDFSLLGSLLLGSLPGIYLGSHAAGWVPERALRTLLASLLLLVGSKLVFQFI